MPTAEKHEAQLGELFRDLQLYSIVSLYPALAATLRSALRRWRQRFSDDVWGRLAKRKLKRIRVIKEINEAAPVVDMLLQFLKSDEATKIANNKPWYIVDLCSGYGFMSMFLSELLPTSSVKEILLVDAQFAMASAKLAKKTQAPTIEPAVAKEKYYISTDHLCAQGWPIPLRIRKQNLKSGVDIRQLHKFIAAKCDGCPVLLCAVHLCGTLSLRAVQFFNEHPTAAALALKPCCLPPAKHTKQELRYEVGGHSFLAEDLGDVRTTAASARLATWASHLTAALPDGESASKSVQVLDIQQSAGTGNHFIFAQRLPAPTDMLDGTWAKKLGQAVVIEGRVVEKEVLKERQRKDKQEGRVRPEGPSRKERRRTRRQQTLLAESSSVPNTVAPEAVSICRAFKRGGCRFGDRCKYLHPM
jgi:hypothetical protein